MKSNGRFEEYESEFGSYSLYVEGYRGEPEDRVEIHTGSDPEREAFLLCVADGVGGRPGGKEASETVVEHLRELSDQSWWERSPDDWETWLSELDNELKETPEAGMTTVVVASVSSERICGASAGDSELWVLEETDVRKPTKNQFKRPFPGSGQVHPVSFEWEHRGKQILAATDGFWKYTSRNHILNRAREESVTSKDLVDLVRLQSGALQDDVGIVLVRFNGLN